jgi:hypothetical protein
MKKKIFKYLGLILLIYLLSNLVTPFNKTLRNRSARNQITYLSDILSKGYDDKLQQRFPEGKLFSNAILALSIINYCDNNRITTERYVKIVDDCIHRIQSNKALETFDPTLTPQYGMFYNGWANFVYSRYKKSPLFAHSTRQDEVKKQSTIIEKRLATTLSDSLRLLDTYTKARWPADNLIGLISLSDTALQQRWATSILRSTNHPTGLIHHTDSDRNLVRGSSSAMITYCLGALGHEKILLYNHQFQDLLVTDFLGIQLVKENEDGSNEMDIDSGPVVLGYGASATIMNIKTQASLGNPQGKITWAVMNMLAAPINLFGKKYYLLQQEPMLDLFMLWGCVELE